MIGRRAMWSGSLTFGLVSVPVALVPGIRNAGVSFRMLAPDGVPLKRRYYCPRENKPISRDEIVRGAEIGKEKFVMITDDELESLSPKKSREIDLRLFVPLDQIDPFYFDRSYFLAPTGDTTKPYRLLAETMEITGRAGIATFIMRGKEYLVAIVAENGILRAETLRFSEEIRTPEEVGLSRPQKVEDAAVKRMIENIRKTSADKFDTGDLKDETGEKILQLVSKKKKAGEVIYYESISAGEEEDEEEERGAEVIDLMELLKKSIEEEEPSSPPEHKKGPSGSAPRKKKKVEA